MEKTSFNLEISYSQIAIFLNGLKNPFNDWTDIHVEQGFSWRKESVCFGTLSGYGQCKVNVRIENEIIYSNKAIRVIIVPFKVGKRGIEVASITESIEIDIHEGNYELVFCALPKASKEGNDIYEIIFIKNENPKERIILADDDLMPPNKLLMKAKAAK